VSIKPIARGVMLCERVIVEEGTHNVSPINIFTRRLVNAFPSAPQQFDVFALLVGGQGRVKLTVRISRGDTLMDIIARDNTIEFASKLQEVRFIRRIENCVFPAPGKYQVELFADYDLIALTAFDVLRRE
jgi:hypothetical protein